MLPVYAVYAFISYLVLALLIPLCLALVPVWHRSRSKRHVKCPAFGNQAVVDLDPWYAVRRHTFGNDELRIRTCTEWHRCDACNQECLLQIAAAA